VKGTLFGTTAGGGIYTGGSVFSITKAGIEHVLHELQLSFQQPRSLATYYDHAGQTPQVDIDGFSCGNSKTQQALPCSIDVPFDRKGCILFLGLPGQAMPDTVHIECPTALEPGQ
jgi:uncharacterized repeat protein (TIGR03803 family)